MKNNKQQLKWFTVLLLTSVLIAGCSNSRSHSKPNNPPAASSSQKTPNPSASQPAVPATEPHQATPSKLAKVTFHSAALGKQMQMNVYLPPDYDTKRRYPVLYLLHGYFGNESAWMPQMKLEKVADRLIAAGRIEPLIIAAPDIDNSYGLNSSEKYRVATPKDPVHSRYYGRYEDYFIQDVLSFVDDTYSTIASKEGRYVGGYSMGGFVSLHVAFRHPELFSKVGGHSPALWTDWSRVPRMKSWLYPTKASRQERDPVELAQTADLSGMSIYLDCGNADDFKLYAGTKKLYDILQRRGIPSEYHLNPGNHSRTYWSSRIEDYLLFYGAKPPTPR